MPVRRPLLNAAGEQIDPPPRRCPKCHEIATPLAGAASYMYTCLNHQPPYDLPDDMSGVVTPDGPARDDD